MTTLAVGTITELLAGSSNEVSTHQQTNAFFDQVFNDLFSRFATGTARAKRNEKI